MSRFFHSRYASLKQYTPGEQPRDKAYIKLNTNESPYPPSNRVVQAVEQAAKNAHLYCDPSCTLLRLEAARVYQVDMDEVLCFNGSDEVLSFAFSAFGEDGVAYPALSYGFYPIFARMNLVEGLPIPLDGQMRIVPEDYHQLGKAIVIANPNAPTGQFLPPEAVEGIARSNPNHVVVIDEAYIDFGGQSALPLIKKYENLLVTRTFSKSHSLAGARVGFGFGCKELMRDIDTLRCSVNPYNVSSIGQAAGLAALEENGYYMACCKVVAQTRETVGNQLLNLGFSVTPSLANFLFASHPDIPGEKMYQRLRDKGIMVRWFNQDGIRDYVRISIGSPRQMEDFMTAVQTILQEERHA